MMGTAAVADGAAWRVIPRHLVTWRPVAANQSASGHPSGTLRGGGGGTSERRVGGEARP